MPSKSNPTMAVKSAGFSARYAGEILALAGAYALSGRLGLSFDAVSGFATLLWPPAGIALACLLRFGFRLWPGVWLGALIVNLWTGAALPVAMGIAVGNTLEVVVAVYALERVGFRPSLDRLGDVIALIGWAAVTSTIVAATVGVVSLYLGGVLSPGAFGITWRVWWLGDLIGDLVVGPVLLSIATWPRGPLRPIRIVEAAALVASTVMAALCVFGPLSTLPQGGPFRQPYVLFPLLVWGAVRFGQRGAAFTVFLLSAIAVLGTSKGGGPFVHPGLHESLLFLQVYIGTTAATVLPLGAVVVERRNAERDLHEAVARKGAIIDAGLDCVVTIDHEDRIIEFNPAAEKVFGHRRDDVLSRPMADILVPPSLRAAHKQGLARHLATGEARLLGRRVEYPALRADGSEFPAEITIVRVPVEGKPLFTGFVRDLSDRKRAEADLHRSYSLLQAVIEGTTDSVFVKDLQGRYLLINSAGAGLLGKAAAEVLSKDDSASFPAEVAWDVMMRDRAIMQAAQTVALEEVVEVDGVERTFLSIKGPYRNHAGEVAGLIGISRDISERKRLEGELREAVRGRDEFLSIASHELRTPLTTLELQLEGLRRLMTKQTATDGWERTLRKVDTAIRQTDRLTALIDGLLDVSRISLGMVRLDVEEFDFASLVNEVLDRFSDEALRAGCVISSRVSGGIVGRWDRVRIDQALSNLVTNAVKYGRGQPIDVIVEASAESVTFVIRDRGIGIAPEDLKRIFERFERAVPSKHYGGLGLGLFIARQVVDAHRGSIVAESRLGEGATFTMRLPRRTLDAASKVSAVSEKRLS